MPAARRVAVVARVRAPPRAASPPQRSGEGRSGLPKPRSITSSPARRSSSFSSLIAAKTYGGRLPTRRSSIREPPAGRGEPSPRRGWRPRGRAPRRSPLRTPCRPDRPARRRRLPRRLPRRLTTPTPSRLAPPCTIARRAPASTPIRPRTGLPNRSQSLKADSLRSAAANRVPFGSPATIGPSTSSPAPPAITVGIPAAAASSAASTLLRIPPLPSGLESPSSTPLACAPSASSSAPGSPGRPRVHAVDLGQEHEQPRAQQHCNLRGEGVVVAEGDLVRGGGVVLVHDRNDAEVEQRVQRVADIDVGGPVADVGGGEQHLRRRRRRERCVPRGLEPRLTERRGSLELRDRARAPLEPEPREPERDRARGDDADRLACRDERAGSPVPDRRAARGERRRPARRPGSTRA